MSIPTNQLKTKVEELKKKTNVSQMWCAGVRWPQINIGIHGKIWASKTTPQSFFSFQFCKLLLFWWSKYQTPFIYIIWRHLIHVLVAFTVEIVSSFSFRQKFQKDSPIFLLPSFPSYPRLTFPIHPFLTFIAPTVSKLSQLIEPRLRITKFLRQIIFVKISLPF